MKRTITHKTVWPGIIMTWLSVSTSFAQLYNGGKEIYISPNTTVTVRGDIQNKGPLFNYGDIILSGNWDNQDSKASYNSEQEDSNEGGSLTLNGSNSAQKQTIKHNGQSFHTLVLDGATEKELQDNATVTHKLDLKNGILTPAANSVFLLKNNADINGGSANSYINGKLFHEGTTNAKLFPVGKDGMYAPISLTDMMGTTEPAPVTGFEVFKDNRDAQTGLGLSRVSAARYWERTQRVGSLTQGKVVLHVDEQDDISDLESAVVAEALAKNSPFRSIGRGTTTGNASDGTISSRENIIGNFFTLGITSADGQMEFFFMPSAFSPASVNQEDKVLKIYGAQLFESSFLFSVYDRWGNLVYESRSVEEMTSKGWEGNHLATGQPLMGGVYTYLLRVKLASGQPFQKVGTVTLIR